MSKKTTRILELDALRALAAINLLLFHFTLVYQNKYGYASPLGFDFPYGKYGVQLFFMLSGFVNAMTLLKKREPGDFLMSRVIRIFPSFWIVILLNIVLLSTCTMFAATPTASQFAANMTAMPRLFGYECWEPVTWTLQVELIFYMILLVLFKGGALNRPLRTVCVLIGISGFGMMYCYQANAMNPESAQAAVSTFVSGLLILKYLPLFGIGILLHEIRFQRSNSVLNGIGIVACSIVFHLIDDHGHNPAATLVLLGLLTLSAYGKLPVLRWKPFAVISASSYALYLFHNNLGCLLIKNAEGVGLSPVASFVIGVVFAFVFAIAYTYWLEQPLTAYLRKQWKNWKSKMADHSASPAISSQKFSAGIKHDV